MDGTDGITDPTDWTDTAVTSLQPLESSLRCQICKEFFVNPVITSCAHTFCSLCIRRCLTHDGKCPTCRTDDQPLRLRKNAVVEELVDIFQRARPEILQMGREIAAVRQGGPVPSSLKRKLEQVDITGEEEDGRSTKRKTRSQSRRVAPSASPSVYEVSDDDDDDGHGSRRTAKPVNYGKVECPICARRMREEDVFPHIDRDHSEPSIPPPRAQTSTMFGLQRPNANDTNPVMPEKLSALSYNLMNESALRKKLGTLGIPSYGSKQVLESRHREWLNIWNANSDSTKPRPKRDLLRDLDVWERTQGSQVRGTSDAKGIMSKEFDRDAWSQGNDNDFKSLIARARAKKKVEPPKEPDKGGPGKDMGDGHDSAVPEFASAPTAGNNFVETKQMPLPDR